MTIIAKDYRRKSVVLAALEQASQPATVPEVQVHCKEFSKHQVSATLNVLADEGAVNSVGENTNRRWTTQSDNLPVPSTQADHLPEEPEQPLFVMEVWPDGVRMSHHDATTILGAFK